MITIYDRNNEVIGQGDIFAEGIIEKTNGRDVLIYINYITKGSEDGIKINFQVFESISQNWFPIQFDNGEEVVIYERLISSNSRIVLPVAENEDKLKLNVSFEGNTISVGTVEIWMLPNYYRY